MSLILTNVILSYTHNTCTNISGNIVNNHDKLQWTNEHTSLLKYNLSHFILERVNFGCVWEVSWRLGQTPGSSGHNSTSFSSWLGLLNRGSLRAAGCQFGILSPTDSNSNWNWPKPSVESGYIIFRSFPLFVRLCTQVNLLTGGSVEGQFITICRL